MVVSGLLSIGLFAMLAISVMMLPSPKPPCSTRASSLAVFLSSTHRTRIQDRSSCQNACGDCGRKVLVKFGGESIELREQSQVAGSLEVKSAIVPFMTDMIGEAEVELQSRRSRRC